MHSPTDHLSGTVFRGWTIDDRDEVTETTYQDRVLLIICSAHAPVEYRPTDHVLLLF